MEKNQHGFSIFERVIILVAVGVLITVGLYLWHQKNVSDHKTQPVKELLIRIKSSGSTNLTAWNLGIFSDGSANLICDSGPQPNKSCNNASYKPNAVSAHKLSIDLARTPLDSQYRCPRSVSFGSVETLIYRGKSVRGIDCYFSDNPDSPLTKDITSFLQKANLN